MYIVDGIAYAGEPKQSVKVSGFRVYEDFTLWIRFNNGETKIVDFKPLLQKPAFRKLNNFNEFKNAYIDFGVLTWDDGNIDVAPEYLYEVGVSA